MVPTDKSLPMHLSVRAFPAFWVPKPLPDNINSKEQAEEYAREFALISRRARKCASRSLES